MTSEAPENTEINGAAPQVAANTEAEANAPAPEQEAASAAAAPGAPEPRMPTRKDVSLRELLHKIDDYAPIVGSTMPFHVWIMLDSTAISFYLYHSKLTRLRI